MAKLALLERLRRINAESDSAAPVAPVLAAYPEYVDNPVGFIREVLGENLPEDLARVAQSVLDVDTTVVRSCNGPGKTWLAARLIVWFLLTHDSPLVFAAAAPPLRNLVGNLWGQVGDLARKHPRVFAKAGITRKQLRLHITDLVYAQGVTIPQAADPAQVEASFSGKHAPNLFFVLDEGDGIPRAVYNGIESCKSGGQRVRLLVLFNPREESGPLYEMEAEERAQVVELSAFRHPNVVTGKQLYPGAVDRETTVRRIIEWSRPLAPGEQTDGECFEVPSFLEGCVAKSASGKEYPPLAGGWRKIEDIRFCHMVLGQYSARGSDRNIFNKAYLAGLEKELLRRDDDGRLVHSPVQVIHPGVGRLRGTLEIYRQPKPGEICVLGADVAKGLIKDGAKEFDRDYSTMDIFNLELEQLGSYWGREGCEPSDFGRDMAAVAGHFNEALVVCEKNGPGVAALEELVDRQKYRNVYYRQPPTRSRAGAGNSEDQRWGFWTDEETKVLVDTAFADAINEAAREIGGLTLRNVRLIREAKNYGFLEGGKRGAIAGHDDQVRSAGLAVYVIKTDPPASRRNLKPRESTAVGGSAKAW